MDAVEIRGLTKRYGAHAALRGLDLRVPVGRLFGFLGPNGAGKTTTIRILLGLLRATSGTARVLGRDAWADGPRVRTAIGYLSGDVRLYDNLTGRATIEFLDAAHGGRTRSEVERLTRSFDLDLDRRVGGYSRGMKQKLGLISALMHRPRLLILDEPTIGLDPLVRETLYQELRDVARDGRTVLFSSHTLAEVEELCDEVAILRNGRLVERERMDVLRERALRHVDLRFPAGVSLPQLPDGLQVSRQDERHLRGVWTGRTDRLIAWLNEVALEDVTIAPPDLEDLFLAYYTETDAEDVA